MTDAREFYNAAMAILVPIVAIGLLTCLALLLANIGDELRRKPLRLRRRERPAVRPITDADLDAVAADLDAWEAEMYANLDAALPESWVKAEGKADIGVPAPLDLPQPVPSEPRHAQKTTPLMHKRDLADFAPQPVRPGQAVAVVEYTPLTPTWWSYGADAAATRAAMLAGQPLHDEQAHAGNVLRSLSRPRDYVDAMPVSPAPVGRPTSHRWGVAEGTETQRTNPAFVSWEQPTGALPIVRTSKVLVSA